ncbi:siderophore-interacting protein [Roseomonas sp. SSH11]|uniref:Siderophore-interacting protein n=1 Tax=Pararoseomonas baculiformis TaxID=2820812 RepID=A0ABS4ABU3_9PROT|nr:siderophore-interacting protein [Pararoseomonas baculiformis]MBP0444451.1 siderophore-interacting protein [Pararoseomonas baculiformis]
MTTLIAEARARTRSPEALIARFREHMVDHGLQVAGPLADSRIIFPDVTALLRMKDGEIDLRIEAANPDRLADAKNIVSGHLDAFATDEALGIVWIGDGAVPPDAHPHNFRALRVLRVTALTPRMRRLTLSGEKLERFDADQMHVKILMPEKGAAPTWPGVSPSGQPILDGCGLTRRTYTIRSLDLAAGTLDIDFVLHGEESPGSRFAIRAEPGDWLGIMGPGGGTIAADGWTLLAGDETALPAIARGMEKMPADARGVALIEVADPAEEQPLRHPPGIALRWVHRNGAPYGERLLEAVRGVEWPEGESPTCWAACENATARALREHWGERCGLDRSRFRAVAYWRQGAADGEG